VAPSDETKRDPADILLSLPTLERQADFLRSEGLLNADGLDRLLDTADGLLNGDPGKSQRLAHRCAALAEDADALAAVPRAKYILAGAHDVNGDFDAELRLTQAAYDGYVALGMHLEALRTNAGKMVALLELGRDEEALAAGRVVLEALNGEGDPGVRATPRDTDLLSALVRQNQAICYEQMGRYDEALEAHALAEKHYRSLGAEERLGEIMDNRGVILRYLGRGSEALEAHRAAATIFDEANLTLAHATALGNIGETCSQLGDYTRGLDAFERARRLLGSLDAPVSKHVMLLDTANTYLALNLYPEALAAYKEANELLESSGMTFEHARGLWGVGSAFIACARFEEAERALDEAAAAFGAANNIPLLSGVMLEQASLLSAHGDREAAVTVARRAMDLVQESAWPVAASLRPPAPGGPAATGHGRGGAAPARGTAAVRPPGAAAVALPAERAPRPPAAFAGSR